MGNRLTETRGSTTDTLNYSSISNKPDTITQSSMTVRSFGWDNAGNLISDVYGSNIFDFDYNARNRLVSVTNTGGPPAPSGAYGYNALEQLATRTLSPPSSSAVTIEYIYDTAGHLIAEADAATGDSLREYIWLDDRPAAVVTDISALTPTIWFVHADHLARPIAMTDGSKAFVWQAVWKPFGEVYSITGAASLDARFPGQWFQIETGLAYNWHRHYDASLGRYTQADPLGFVDGPSRYAYTAGSPAMMTDPKGLELPGGARPPKCRGSKWFYGNHAHDLFTALLVATGNAQNKGFNNSFARTFLGRPDVYDGLSGKVWELKPTSYGSGYYYEQAKGQLGGYIASGNRHSILNWGGPLWSPGSWADFFGGSPSMTMVSPLTGETYRFEPDDPQNTGIIFYSCDPPPQICTPEGSPLDVLPRLQ